MASCPVASSFERYSGAFANCTTASLIACTMSSGVSLGANRATHEATWRFCTPASANVGTSGSSGWRCARMIAMPLALPCLISGARKVGEADSRSTSLAMNPLAASVADLYGTWSMSMPAICFTTSTDRCWMPPVPPLPKVSLPGCALA